jgi:hypothetical protein
MIDDAEPWKLYRVEMRTARKEHVCRECARKIAPGERYEGGVGIGDGTWTLKTCAHCIRARQWLSRVCEGWLHTMVYDDLVEHFGERVTLEPELGRPMIWWLALAINGMRAKWAGPDGSLLSLMPELPEERKAA